MFDKGKSLNVFRLFFVAYFKKSDIKKLNFYYWFLILFIMFRKKESKAEVMPLRNQSVEEWQKWAEKANWKNVYEAWQNFLPRGYDPYKEHDRKVLEILRKRLFCIEYPICHVSEKINHLEVPNGIGSASLKALVKDTERDYPYLIVEKSGRYRGIALSPDLIFVGMCWISVSISEAVQKARELKLDFLTREDSEVIEKYFKETNDLLDCIGAPTFREVFWWCVAPLASHAPYEIWKLAAANRKGMIGDDVPIRLFVKL